MTIPIPIRAFVVALERAQVHQGLPPQDAGESVAVGKDPHGLILGHRNEATTEVFVDVEVSSVSRAEVLLLVLGKPLLAPVGQRCVAVDAAVVLKEFELQGLELHHGSRLQRLVKRKEGFYVPLGRATPWWFIGVGGAICIGVRWVRGRTAIVLEQALLLRTSIELVGDAIAVTVWSVKVDAPKVVAYVRIIRAYIIGISHAVEIGIGAPITSKRAPLVRTGIVHVGYRIAIKVGATVEFNQTRFLRAGVILIEGPVAIQIPYHRTSIMLAQAWLSRAGVVGVGHTIAIGVGAATNSRRAWFIGARIGRIEEAIAISITLARRGTPLGVGQARFVGASVRGIRDTVPIPVRAAIRGLGPWLIGTQIRSIGHPIPVSIWKIHNLHTDRALRARPLGVEGSDDQGVRARKERLPVAQ